MSTNSLANRRSVLISGATIAGPALAYWLHRYGFNVTVVEKSATIRLGGYPIDVRGNAIEVAERMGLIESLEAASVGSRKIVFLDGNGENPITLASEVLTGSRIGRDVELSRGALTGMIYDLTRDTVAYRFNTSISALVDGDDGVDVTFSDGTSGRYDIVIGADGLHSNTRALVFGPESQFDRHIGFCFAGFDLPNTFGLASVGLAHNRPGRLLVVSATALDQDVNVFFNMAHPPITRAQGNDLAFQRKLIADNFGDWGGMVPQLVEAMMQQDDLHFDEVKQIRMPAYSKGRVALAGDSAYAPSFMTGQGSSLAMVGAYILASELALHADHTQAFAAYDRIMRPFATANQARVDEGGSALIPLTQDAIDARNAYLRTVTEAPATEGRPEHSMLDLSEYLGIETNRPKFA